VDTILAAQTLGFKNGMAGRLQSQHLKYEGAEQMMFIGGTSIAVVFVALIAYGVYTSGFDKVRTYLIRIIAMGAIYAVMKFGMFV